MSKGARTPEELETLLEDALVMEDLSALAELFDEWAVLAAGCSLPEVRGSREAAKALAGLRDETRPYLAGPRRVIQMRSRALVVTHQGANVVHRGEDGAWRYEVLHLWI